MDEDPPSYSTPSVYPTTIRANSDFLGLVPAGRFTGYVDSRMFSQTFPQGYFVPGLVFIPRNVAHRSHFLPRPHASVVVPYESPVPIQPDTSVHHEPPPQEPMNGFAHRPEPWRQGAPRRL